MEDMLAARSGKEAVSCSAISFGIPALTSSLLHLVPWLIVACWACWISCWLSWWRSSVRLELRRSWGLLTAKELLFDDKFSRVGCVYLGDPTFRLRSSAFFLISIVFRWYSEERDATEGVYRSTSEVLSTTMENFELFMLVSFWHCSTVTSASCRFLLGKTGLLCFGANGSFPLRSELPPVTETFVSFSFTSS